MFIFITPITINCFTLIHHFIFKKTFYGRMLVSMMFQDIHRQQLLRTLLQPWAKLRFDWSMGPLVWRVVWRYFIKNRGGPCVMTIGTTATLVLSAVNWGIPPVTPKLLGPLATVKVQALFYWMIFNATETRTTWRNAVLMAGITTTADTLKMLGCAVVS